MTHPRSNMVAPSESLRERYERAGQDHVFEYLDEITDEERVRLLKQLEDINVENLSGLLEAAKKEVSRLDSFNIEPFLSPIGSSTDEATTERSKRIGIEAISDGKVAALVLAGGQGTRLGFDGPKGMYDILLPSGRTLFQMIAERILKLLSLAGASSLPFYIMTSPVNHDMTVDYFEANDYFGLGKENVVMFQQGMLPCLTEEGKIIMETASQVSMAPDGNGGVYQSLQSSGALQTMKERGVEYLHVFSIDNALVKPADPVFVGYCIEQKADCGIKAVRKAHAHEKVGVVAQQSGCPRIIEYSEMTPQMTNQTDATGRLVYGAANICNHFYTLEFIEGTILPNIGNLYHIAHKKIPYWNGLETAKPPSNNGIKLETFIFDVFPLSKRMAVWEVDRNEEFAPVKNAPGEASDSPDTARVMISSLAKTWLCKAGANLVGDENVICEISPSVSYAGEGLEGFKGKTLSCPFYL